MQDVWTQDQMIEQFWRAANKGLEDEVIRNHSLDPKLLAIRLVAVHAAAAELGVELPPVYLLRKAVRRCPRFLRIRWVRGPKGTRAVSCWIFKRQVGEDISR